MWDHGNWGALWMLVTWAGFILLFVWAITGTGRRPTPGETRNAIDILEERYARGELDHEEFQARRAELRGA